MTDLGPVDVGIIVKLLHQKVLSKVYKQTQYKLATFKQQQKDVEQKKNKEKERINIIKF